jgi:hypothetical protein
MAVWGETLNVVDKMRFIGLRIVLVEMVNLFGREGLSRLLMLMGIRLIGMSVGWGMDKLLNMHLFVV